MDNGDVFTGLITAGENWMSQAPASLHFGLGATARIERVEIDWPGDFVSGFAGRLFTGS